MRRRWFATDSVVDIRRCLAVLGETVACDIETDGISPLTNKVICICVSDGIRTLVIDPWQPEVHAALVTEAFADRRVVFHNGYNFDQIALERDGVVFARLPEDTLIAHHTFASHLPQKLDQLASEYCDTSPWKMQHGMRGGGAEKGNLPHKMEPAERDLYNAIDGVLTFLCWERLQGDLKADMAVYEADKRLADACKRMQVLGIGVDGEKRARLGDLLRRRQAAIKGQMRALLTWPAYTPSKTAHVREALYKRLQAPVVSTTPSGLEATGGFALEALATQKTDAGRFARLQMTWRLVSKVASTYVAPIPVLHDGRAHYNWKSFGTVSGRLASRIMSCPRYGALPEQAPRSLYVATGKLPTARLVLQVHDAACFEVGEELVYFDLSQAEARFAAYLSGDDALITAVQTDIHTANAQVIFGGIPGVSERLALANEKSPSGVKWKALPRAEGGCKEERDVTKNLGFCVWYVGGIDQAFVTLQQRGFPVTLKACTAFHKKFHDHYWKYYRYVDQNLALVRKQGYMRTVLSGRFRWLGFFPDLPDVANYPIQSGIADVMNERLLDIEASARSMTRAEDVENLIRETWAVPVVLPVGPLVAKERSFVLPCDLKRGRSWSDFG